MSTLLETQHVAVSPHEQKRRANGFHAAPNTAGAHPLGPLTVATGHALVEHETGFVVGHDLTVHSLQPSGEWP